MARTKKAEKMTPAPEAPPEAPAPEQPENEAPIPAPETEYKKEPEAPAGERPLPYRATVAVAVAVVRKAVGPGTAEMLKPVGTLKRGAAVTVKGRFEGYAQLANGLWIDESFLSV